MAASGLAECGRDRAKISLLQLKKVLLGQAFEVKDSDQNLSELVHYLEQWMPPNSTASSASKTNSEFPFRKDPFAATRVIGRSPSTDSIAASNSSSDQGSIDAFQYSNHGSYSRGASPPCSPEMFSRPCTPQPARDEPMLFCNKSTTPKEVDDFCDDNASEYFSQASDKIVVKTEPVDPSYLQPSDQMVPNLKEEPSISEAESQSVPSPNGTREHTSARISTHRTGPLNSAISCTNRTSCSTSEVQHCNWILCNAFVEGNAELVEHLKLKHVQPQLEKKSFTCLWMGCKVYNKPSCSSTWLERHVISHTGIRPFKCIVGDCNQRFPTQAAVERHVNLHFASTSQGSKVNKNREECAPKSLRRRKNSKYKTRRNTIAKTEDFFDAHIMEQIKYKLVEINNSYQNDGSKTILFQSKVIARRVDKSGKVNVLLKWIPENILPDSWVPEDSVTAYKTVSYSSLPMESLAFLDPLIKSNPPPPKKRRRK